MSLRLYYIVMTAVFFLDPFVNRVRMARGLYRFETTRVVLRLYFY